jgi:hypothetical protein
MFSYQFREDIINMLKKNLSILIIMAMFIICLSHGADFAYAMPGNKTDKEGLSIPVISLEAQYDQGASHTWTHPLTMEIIIPASSVFSAQDAIHITFPSNVVMSSVHVSPETKVSEFEVATNNNTFSLTSKAERSFTQELRIPIEFHLQNVADTGEISVAFRLYGDDSAIDSDATPLTVISIDSPDAVDMAPYTTPAPMLRILAAFPFDEPFRINHYTALGFNNLIQNDGPWNSISHFFDSSISWNIYSAIIVTNYETYDNPFLALRSSHPVVDGSVMVSAQHSSSELLLIAPSEYSVGSSSFIGGVYPYLTIIQFPNNFSEDIYEYFVNFAVGNVGLSPTDTTRASAFFQDANVFTNPLYGEEATGEFRDGAVTLTVEKEVVGTYANTTLEFDFKMVISHAVAPPYLPAIPFIKTAADGSTTSGSIVLAVDGTCEYTLAHGERIVFTLNTLDPRAIWYTITEYLPAGYTVEASGPDSAGVPQGFRSLEEHGVLGGNFLHGLVAEDSTVVFRNTREPSPVPTAAPIFDSPFATMSLLAAVLITCYIGYIYYKKKI